MSSPLSSLFNRGLLGTKCKTCLTLTISRIKLLRNRREVQLAHMRKEISQFLATGQEAIARIRVEHVIREQNTLAAYEIVELFCEFVLARVPILDTQRTCPTELQEAVSSIIFAAPRCPDIPELIQIKNLFTSKYGKEFVAVVSELRPDCGVNRVIIEKLSIKAPPGDVKLGVMKAIAQEYNVYWDSSATEAEFSKKHEDLLDGANRTDSNLTLQRSSVLAPIPKVNEIIETARQGEGFQTPEVLRVAPSEIRTNAMDFDNKSNPISNREREIHDSHKSGVAQSDGDVLARARAAMASADRACAAARAAANLVNSRVQTGITK